jgi:adenylate cyclase
MPMKDDILLRVKEALAPGEYQVHDSTSIPGPGDNRVTFGNTAVRFEAAALYIDMRGSTAILNRHKAHSVAKIHKAYLYAATTVLAERGGHIRSYNGDSILAFFQGGGGPATAAAVRAAMEVKYMLDNVCKVEFERFGPLDFGIGIDHGHVLCAKAGRARNENHNDLIWLGNAVNRAAKLGNKAKGPSHVWISDGCRGLLPFELRVSNGREVWSPQQFAYDQKPEAAWGTTFHLEVK